MALFGRLGWQSGQVRALLSRRAPLTAPSTTMPIPKPSPASPVMVPLQDIKNTAASPSPAVKVPSVSTGEAAHIVTTPGGPVPANRETAARLGLRPHSVGGRLQFALPGGRGRPGAWWRGGGADPLPRRQLSARMQALRDAILSPLPERMRTKEMLQFIVQDAGGLMGIMPPGLYPPGAFAR